MFNLKNIIAGKIESIIGFVIIVIALITVLTGKADWTQAGVGIALGIGLLPFKLKNGGGEVSIIVFCVSMLALVSCQPKPIAKSSSTKDSIVIKERLVKDTITIKGDTVELEIQIPCKELAGTTFKAKSKSGRTTAKLYVDSTGKAKIECHVDDYVQVIEWYEQLQEIWHKKEDVYIQEINKPFPWYVKAALAWSIFSLFFLVIVIAYLIFKTIK